MKLTMKGSNCILVKDDGTEVRVNPDDPVQYTGIYYKNINDIVDMVEIETDFIGVVESHRYRHDEGVTGIYIRPLYIWSKVNSEWNKIIDYEPPTKKYFFYPHFLMLPNHYHNYRPLYFLHTCENKPLPDVNNITREFSLHKTLSE
jgi:hypothetical protein